MQFLEQYTRNHNLFNLSASVEAAVAALRQQTLLEEYEAFAREYDTSPTLQREAELWLEHSLPRDG